MDCTSKQALLQVAKHIMQYIKGTTIFGPMFFSNTSSLPHTFTNVDSGQDLDTQKSTSSITYKLGNNNILWSIKLEPNVSFSTTKVEYGVLNEVTKDVFLIYNNYSMN